MKDRNRKGELEREERREERREASCRVAGGWCVCVCAGQSRTTRTETLAVSTADWRLVWQLEPLAQLSSAQLYHVTPCITVTWHQPENLSTLAFKRENISETIQKINIYTGSVSDCAAFPIGYNAIVIRLMIS